MRRTCRALSAQSSRCDEAVVVVAYPAFESGEAAAGIDQPAAQLVAIDGRMRETEGVRLPPVELFAELSARHRFTLSADHLKVAVNAEFSDWSRPLNAGDTVVFIPPVAGG